MSGQRQRWCLARTQPVWAIGAVITTLTLTLLWQLRDVPLLARVDWTALQAIHKWKPTFFIHRQPAVVKDGQLVQPAQTYYTVPSKLVEPLPPPLPAPSPKR